MLADDTFAVHARLLEISLEIPKVKVRERVFLTKCLAKPPTIKSLIADLVSSLSVGLEER